MNAARFWGQLSTRVLPFADAATPELPMGRLLRLSLFQVTVGMAAALLIGTLNRVMIIELGASASLVACMLALPLIFAPARAIVGFKSDHHRSAFGWKRVPYLWFGTLLQFGGLAILPFALLVMSGDNHAPVVLGQAAAAFAFLLIGAGLHTVQTAGLALATDLAPEEARPRVVALLYVMLLVGTLLSAVAIGWALRDYSQLRLIQVIQGAAALTAALNLAALWKQEARSPREERGERADFSVAWRGFIARPRTRRLLIAISCGGAAFAAQDVLVEPYGGEVLGLSVGQTTWLTALWAGGTLTGFAIAARQLKLGADPLRLAGFGVAGGMMAFLMVIMAAPLASAPLLSAGVIATGIGGGLFAVGTLVAAMMLAEAEGSGLALGAWGAAQATAIGVAIAGGGIARDLIGRAALSGMFGEGLVSRTTGYVSVYLFEVVMLLVTLAVLGPLAGRNLNDDPETAAPPFGAIRPTYLEETAHG
jgi:BCD family chlorophyll transporter-like MFS transporter